MAFNGYEKRLETKYREQERADVQRRDGESKLDWIQRIVPAWYFEVIREKLNVEQVDQHFGVVGCGVFKPGKSKEEVIEEERKNYGVRKTSGVETGTQFLYSDAMDAVDDNLQ
jgi:hypothetical protein